MKKRKKQIVMILSLKVIVITTNVTIERKLQHCIRRTASIMIML